MRTIEQNANSRSGYQKAARGAQMLKGAVKAGSGIASGNFVAVAQGVVEALSPKVILIIVYNFTSDNHYIGYPSNAF